MREIIISPNEAGQRLDKFLKKYLREASGAFLYKMLRKKNITLNGGKAAGNEMVEAGDKVKLFLAEETIEKFRGEAFHAENFPAEKFTAEIFRMEASEEGCAGAVKKQSLLSGGEGRQASSFPAIPILYEDAHILLAGKPSGVLTQKAAAGDYTLNEWLIDYLLFSGQLTREELRTFRPSVCNRLDRNTSGLVICGKTLAGSQQMSQLLRDRTVHKYYRLYAAGRMRENGIRESWLVKDAKTNQVTIYDARPDEGDAVPIRTGWRVLKEYGAATYMEVELFTGKTHQIRAQMAALCHPLIGDAKYGTPSSRKLSGQAGVRSQLLHAYRLTFPEMAGEFAPLSRRSFTAPEPEEFERFRLFLCGGTHQDREGRRKNKPDSFKEE